MDDLKFRRVQQLKQVLDNPVFADVVKDVSDDIMSAIAATGMPESALREAYYFELLALDRVIGKLNAYAGEVVFVREKEKQRG